MVEASETFTTSKPRRSFVERLLGALRLDASTYDEVEHDPEALGQAALVVVLSAVAMVIGLAGSEGAIGVVGGAVGSLVGWAVSAAFVWVIGVYWMQHTSDYKELLRTLGFASAPQLLMVLGVIPLLGALMGFVASIWGLAAYVIAVREALDVTTGRAIVVCLLAFGLRLVTIILLAAVAGVFGAASPSV